MTKVRLIDANALKNAIDSAYTVYGQCVYVRGIVDRQPTIEAEPVRHGRWIKQENHGGSTYSVCSECGAMMNLPWYWYCGKCGARMDGGAEND